MNTLSAVNAYNNFYSLIDKTATTHKPVSITHNNKNVVMLSETDYLSLQETLHIKSNKAFSDEIIRRKNDPKSEFIDDIGLS
jgi:prevent-host-death family protein